MKDEFLERKNENILFQNDILSEENNLVLIKDEIRRMNKLITQFQVFNFIYLFRKKKKLLKAH